MSVLNVRVHSLAGIPAIIAYEFQCVPCEGSLVVALLNGHGEVIVMTRSDHPEGDVRAVETAQRAEAAIAVLVGYGCTDDVEDRQMALARALREAGVRVGGMLIVDGQQWQDRVSGTGGTLEPVEVVRATGEGMQAGPEPMVSRTQQEVEARVQPVAGAIREPGNPEGGEDLLAAMSAGVQDRWSDAEVASMAAALQDHLLRDVIAAAWLMQPRNTAAERARAVEALRGLAVRVDGPLAAEPLVLLALAAWCGCQTILARAALDRLARLVPGHRLGVLVGELMTLGPASMLWK